MRRDRTDPATDFGHSLMHVRRLARGRMESHARGGDGARTSIPEQGYTQARTSVQTPVPYVRVSLGRLSIGESRIGPPVIDTPVGVDTDAVVMMSDVGEVMVSGSASARRHTSARA